MLEGRGPHRKLKAPGGLALMSRAVSAPRSSTPPGAVRLANARTAAATERPSPLLLPARARSVNCTRTLPGSTDRMATLDDDTFKAAPTTTLNCCRKRAIAAGCVTRSV